MESGEMGGSVCLVHRGFNLIMDFLEKNSISLNLKHKTFPLTAWALERLISFMRHEVAIKSITVQ